VRRVRVVYLDGNRLTGAIPAELGRCTKLRKLHLNYNQLSGPIPASLGRCAALTSLVLHSNQLCGPIPSALGRCRLLSRLLLHHNQLTGAVPRELANCAALKVLTLHNNCLDGTLPATIATMPSLADLTTNDNATLHVPLAGAVSAVHRAPLFALPYAIGGLAYHAVMGTTSLFKGALFWRAPSTAPMDELSQMPLSGEASARVHGRRPLFSYAWSSAGPEHSRSLRSSLFSRAHSGKFAPQPVPRLAPQLAAKAAGAHETAPAAALDDAGPDATYPNRSPRLLKSKSVSFRLARSVETESATPP